MPTLLAIQVGPRHQYSTSRKLSAVFVEKWPAAHPGGKVIERDLMKTNLPFADMPWIGGAFTPPEQHSPESAAAIKASHELVAEVLAPDHLPIGTPMYNFSIPAALKAYIDHIVRLGLTFSADNVDLLTGKKGTVILASGYLRQVLGYIGIADLEFIMARRARAGETGETALEAFGEAVSVAAAA